MRVFLIFLIFSSLILAGCKRPDENPHLMDPVYIDLVQSKAEIEGAIAKEDKTLLEKRAELKKVAPQSGHMSTAKKHIWEAENRLYLLKQRLIYVKVRIDSQLDKSYEGYIRSYYNGEAWPKPEDKHTYLLNKPSNGLEPRNKPYRSRKPATTTGSASGKPEAGK